MFTVCITDFEGRTSHVLDMEEDLDVDHVYFNNINKMLNTYGLKLQEQISYWR